MTSQMKISYRYVDPSPAGPFKGSMTETFRGDPPRKGDEIYAPFGRAVITSVRAVKKSTTDN